jgi:hypothetical protein
MVHIATDGESYGHHHQFGEMALAYALHRAVHDPTVRLTNHGEFLALHPPTWEVEVRERTSWSCAHGVERWRADCGCHLGGNPGWHQRWRGPLRDALDRLKDRLDAIFQEHGSRLFRDPWAAREDYIRVIEGGPSANLRAFWEAHRRPGCADTDLPGAVRLLEMQRHGLLMFTSCGWFFDEISGLEATQILRYAARAIQLAESFGQRLEPDFVQALERAQSNLPDLAHGRGVWERFVRPDAATLDRVVAHYAIRSLFRERRTVEELHCYHIHDIHKHVEILGTTQVSLGRVRVRSTVALDELDALFGVVHFGGLDFSCFQRTATALDDVRALQEKIVETYRTGSVGEVYALMREEFPAPIYHLKDLFLDEQRHIIQVVLDERFQDYLRTMELLAEKDLGILNHLATLGYPIPAPLVMASTVHVNRRIEQILQELPEDGNALGEADDLLHRSLAWGYRPDRELWARSLQGRMEGALDGLTAGAGSPEDVFPLCRRILDASARLQIPLNLWRTQNRFVHACWNGWMGWAERLQDAEALARRLSLRETLLPWNRPLESA